MNQTPDHLQADTMADTVAVPVLSAAELAECAEFGTHCSFAAGGPRSDRDCDAESLRRYSREKGGFGNDRADQSSRKTRRDSRDNRVSRPRPGGVRHGCVVPRRRRLDGSVIFLRRNSARREPCGLQLPPHDKRKDDYEYPSNRADSVHRGGSASAERGDRNMKEKQVKLPSPDHPISIQRNPARVVVSVAGRVVADTRNALTLREAAYPPVQYIPPEDVEFSKLERTDHVTYCPYKGDCSYYRVPSGGEKSVNAVWSYEDPFPAVAQIRGHVAFYPERVDEIAERLPT